MAAFGGLNASRSPLPDVQLVEERARKYQLFLSLPAVVVRELASKTVRVTEYDESDSDDDDMPAVHGGGAGSSAQMSAAGHGGRAQADSSRAEKGSLADARKLLFDRRQIYLRFLAPIIMWHVTVTIIMSITWALTAINKQYVRTEKAC